MKLKSENVSSTQLTPVNIMTSVGFQSSLKDLNLKNHTHFHVNQEASKISVGLLAFIVIFRRPKYFKNLTIKDLLKVLRY